MSFPSRRIIPLENFTNPRHEWTVMNDPVMGGKSTGDFEISDDGKGVFTGEVVDVPFLHAPGFIKIETSDNGNWPDISHCEGLQVIGQSDTDYSGYRLSFGHERPKDAFPFIYGYKTLLNIPKGDSSTTISLPFDSFTDNWDPATGDATVSCRDDQQYCPSEKTKHDLYSIAIWGEGVAGKVALNIEAIQAYGCADEVVLEEFSSPTNTWSTMNDPVMGGRSKSSLEIHDGMASFQGTCAIVPFLDAPGFITMVTGRHQAAFFPDVSSCSALKLELRTNVDYSGYFLSFGNVRVPGGGHASGYKVPLKDLPRNEFGEVVIPFSDFSSKWDEATGKIQVKCMDDARYCPGIETLQDMKTMSFWGEGVEGDVSLDIRSIRAIGCASSVDIPRNEPLHPRNVMVVMSWMMAFVVAGLIAFRVRSHRRITGTYEQVKGIEV